MADSRSLGRPGKHENSEKVVQIASPFLNIVDVTQNMPRPLSVIHFNGKFRVTFISCFVTNYKRST